MRAGWLAPVVLVVALAAGCGGGGESLATGEALAGFEFAQESAVAEGQPIDPRYTCDGDDVSPALAWTGVPEGSKELALLVEDPDAPGGVFTHWIVYALDPRESALPEALPDQGQLESPKLRQGKNDFDNTGYGGPCPPEGETHRYAFRLMALDSELGLESLADREGFLTAVEGHVVAEATLTASYSRG